MEAKLKALKVVQLKEILTKSDVSFPSRANKSDLISKILDTPAALHAFKELHSVADEKEAQPEERPPKRPKIIENTPVPIEVDPTPQPETIAGAAREEVPILVQEREENVEADEEEEIMQDLNSEPKASDLYLDTVGVMKPL